MEVIMLPKTQLMGVAPGRGAWLYVVDGAQKGRDYRLGETATIGRDAVECDVILSDPKLSAQHARIRQEGDEFILYDLASKNGTFVNENRVQRQILADNDIIVVGTTKLIFKVTSKL